MPFPIELQGDSRQLAALVGEAAGCVASPPYASSLVGDKHKETGYWENSTNGTITGHYAENGYGTDPANLGNMKAGDFDAVIGSPPYAGIIENGSRIDLSKSKGNQPGPHGQMRQPDYGCSPGQLGAMPAGGFEAAVSSPPYANVNLNCGETQVEFEERLERIKAGGSSWWRPRPTGNFAQPDYGTSDGQLGNATDFWTAARVIVEQVYTVLRPGAHAIWVLKAYVRDKRIVDFPDQWRQMCEACGFETLHVHRAWLVEDHGAQATLDGGVKRKRTERKSFFRRLAESKGSPRIDYEIVLCQVKPLDAASQSGQASACVSSPPWSGTLESKDTEFITRSQLNPVKGHGSSKQFCERYLAGREDGYSRDPANLGNMPAGDFAAAVKPLNSNGKGDTQ